MYSVAVVILIVWGLPVLIAYATWREMRVVPKVKTPRTKTKKTKQGPKS